MTPWPSRTTPTFVGRTAERQSLSEAFDAATAGVTATVLVEGEAGVGKSRLVQEVVPGFRDRGALVAIGRCVPVGDRSLPLVAIGELLRTLSQHVAAEEMIRLAGDPDRLLGLLEAPEAGNGHPRAEPGALSQTLMFESVQHLLQRLGADQPLVLVVEDMQWADKSTCDLLLFLERNLDQARLLLVVTYRRESVEASSPLRRFLSEARRSRRVHRLTVAPFDREELAEHLESLLAAPPRRELVDGMLTRSQGNPFFVEELLAAGTDVRSGLPESLRDLLLATVTELPEDTQRVLEAAAAVGRRVPYDLVAQVSGLPGEQLDAALRPALAGQVLLPHPEPDTYVFRHDLIAEALADSLLPGQRRRLHARLAEVLEGQPWLCSERPAGEIAYHWDAAGEAARCFTASVDAAREAEALPAVAEARDHVRRVADLWDRLDDPVALCGLTRYEVLAWLADLTHLSGDAPQAVEWAEQALLAFPEEGGPARRALLLERLARYRDSCGDISGAIEAWEGSVDLVPAQPASPERARVLASYAQMLWQHDPERGIAIAEEAVSVSRAAADPALEGAALTMRGASLSQAGRVEEGLEQLLAAIDVVNRSGTGEDVGRAYNYLSAVLIRAGRPAEGAEYALLGLERTRELGVGRLYGPALAGNATSGLFLAGRWDEAALLLTEVVGHSTQAGWLLLLQARLLAYRGDFEAAHRALDEVREHRGDVDPRFPLVVLLLAILEGDLELAHQIVEERHRYTAPEHSGTAHEFCALALRAEAARRAAGQDVSPDLSQRLLEEAGETRSAGISHAHPWRTTAIAEQYRIAGDPGTAAAWQEAIDAWRQLDGWQHVRAYSAYRLAEARLVNGEADVASVLREALQAASALGARPLATSISALARRAGINAGQAPVGGLRGLTARELEVLEQLAKGRTNREIATHLFISEKTASVHVSNILRKLDVSTRTEAAALAVREGLV